MTPVSSAFRGTSPRQIHPNFQARRWASSQSPEGASLNPLDQLASPSSAAAERKPKKPDPRLKFQEKGAFGENVYTKGHSKNLSISPYKLNDFVKVLRGLSIHDAIIQCQVGWGPGCPGVACWVLGGEGALSYPAHG